MIILCVLVFKIFSHRSEQSSIILLGICSMWFV